MGGRLVGELAVTGAALAAGVIHYGGPPKLDLVPKIVAPLEGHYASTDTPITSQIPAFAEAMKAAGKEFTYYVYEADHGFSLGNTPLSRRGEAGDDALARHTWRSICGRRRSRRRRIARFSSRYRTSRRHCRRTDRCRADSCV